MKETPKLMLPLQSAPVDRTLGAAALSEGLGVEASQNAGQIIGQVAQSLLPALLSFL